MDPMREMQLAGVLPEAPDPAVEAKPQRRRFTAEYKLGILREVERAKEPGGVGAILRREGPPDGTLLVLLSYLPGLCESCFLRRILSNEPARSEGFRWLG